MNSIALKCLPLAAVVLFALAAAAPLSAQAPRQPIASADADDPGIRVDVQELKRDSGGTLTLRFAIVNDTDKSWGDTCAFRESGSEGCKTISGVHLLDAANKKKYLVVRDAQGKCVCGTIESIAAKSSRNMWAKFPAPPDSVTKISVIIPNFMPLDDVPIGP